MERVVVVDYGMGNLRSVERALKHVAADAEVSISSSPEAVRNAHRVVFPGQGAMPDCMRYLRETGLEDAVRDAADRKPFLGICVGMQMLLEHSEEGDTPGLGILPGRVRRFAPPEGSGMKVPHMGWNEVAHDGAHPIWSGIASDERFYFVHSYYCAPGDGEVTAATCEYSLRFTAALARANIFATQFHPEKSHTVGLSLYRNFLAWTP
ncbi:MAG: imidazole glycerol phosphate synthase subunit HisH [Betaproteobacteria bacterium]|nr:imidazole glycerol phosphate synthase subunit HisH [Betaproteobacteria bacterium]